MVASMGPQSFDCGKNPADRGSDTAGLASMGPQSFDCGKIEIIKTFLTIQGASMGPQSFDCGKIGGRSLTGERHDASMGPQSFDCGKGPHIQGAAPPTRGFNGAAVFRLRKGPSRHEQFELRLHGFNGAAVFRLRKAGGKTLHSTTHAKLQWGRSLSTAERRTLLYMHHKGRSASMGPQSFDCGKLFIVGFINTV